MKLIDLSPPLYSGMPVYPGDPEVEINQVHTIKKEGWRLRTLNLPSHIGAHVDAFAHMDPNGLTLDQMPLNRFFGPCRVVDISQKLPQNIGLLFSTGKLELNYLSKIKATKAPFIVVSADCEFEVELERQLLRNQIVTFTDVINTHKLPTNQEFIFYGFPLNIKDGDGSPIRAIAMIEE